MSWRFQPPSCPRPTPVAIALNRTQVEVCRYLDGIHIDSVLPTIEFFYRPTNLTLSQAEKPETAAKIEIARRILGSHRTKPIIIG